MADCGSIRDWLEGELQHLVETRPESFTALLAAVARLALKTVEKMRESGVTCSALGEARIYADPLRPLDVVLRAYAARDGGEEARVCIAFVMDGGKLCASMQEAIRGRRGGEAAAALRGLLEATAEALRVFESHASNLRVVEERGPMLVLEHCVAVEGEPEDAAERLLFSIRRIVEELGVKLE